MLRSLSIAVALAALASTAHAAVIGGKGIAGYFSADDNFNHAVIARPGGELWEAWWQNQGGVGAMRLTTAWWDPNITQVAGFSDWNVRHDVFVTSNKYIWDYSYVPGQWSSLDAIATVRSGFTIGALDAYHSTWDGHDHYVIAMNQPGSSFVEEFDVNPSVGNSGQWMNVMPVDYFTTPPTTVSAASFGDSNRNQSCYYADGKTTTRSTSAFVWCLERQPCPLDQTRVCTQLHDWTVDDHTSYPSPSPLHDMVFTSDLDFTLTWATTVDWGLSIWRNWAFNGATIYHFIYGPTVREYDAFYVPISNTIHGLTLMSNGDLWDMRVQYNGGPVTWSLVGNY
jgi:hypothetical protein